MIATAFSELQRAIDGAIGCCWKPPIYTCVRMLYDPRRIATYCHFSNVRTVIWGGKAAPYVESESKDRTWRVRFQVIVQHAWQWYWQIAKMIGRGCSLYLNGFFPGGNNGRKTSIGLMPSSVAQRPAASNWCTETHRRLFRRSRHGVCSNSLRPFAASAFMGETAWMARRTRKSCA